MYQLGMVDEQARDQLRVSNLQKVKDFRPGFIRSCYNVKDHQLQPGLQDGNNVVLLEISAVSALHGITRP